MGSQCLSLCSGLKPSIPFPRPLNYYQLLLFIFQKCFHGPFILCFILGSMSLIPAISAGPENLAGEYTQNVYRALTFRHLMTDSWPINLLAALVPLVWNWWIKNALPVISGDRDSLLLGAIKFPCNFVFSDIPSLFFLQSTPLIPQFLLGPLHFVILLSDLIHTHQPSLKSIFSVESQECHICMFYIGCSQDTFNVESIIPWTTTSSFPSLVILVSSHKSAQFSKILFVPLSSIPNQLTFTSCHFNICIFFFPSIPISPLSLPIFSLSSSCYKFFTRHSKDLSRYLYLYLVQSILLDASGNFSKMKNLIIPFPYLKSLITLYYPLGGRGQQKSLNS